MFNMTPYEVYIFVLCCVVFFLLTLLFSIMLGYLVVLTVKLIWHGIMDEKIKKEYKKRVEKKQSRLGVFVDRFVSAVLCLAMCAVFAFSMYLQINESKVPENVPSFKVVRSPSMAEKHASNTYLDGIDNQVQTFDLIVTYHIPAEEELQLYDIIFYEQNDEMILHRIVRIEEPNATHPDERWYITQGDAVSSPDTAPVRYSQMRGIYRNEKIPFAGSFVMFMQSPAGYLCILLVVVAMIATPILEKKLAREKEQRMEVIRNNRGLRKIKQVKPKKIFWEVLKIGLVFLGFRYLYRHRLRKHKDDKNSQ